MKKLLAYITENLTGSKDVEIEETEDQGVKIYTIKAPKEVMGMLIGKEGRTARAIRSLAKAKAIIDQVNVNIRIEEAVV